MSAKEILNQYANGEISLEAANKALAEAGAGFHLEPSKVTGGWTEQEMKEGFMPGKPSEVLPDRPDMKRRMDLAGKTVIQRTKGARYEVTYANDGYALVAKLIK